MIKFKITLMTSMTLFAMSCADAEKPKSRILNSYGVQQVFSELGDWFNKGEGSEGSRVDWVYKNVPEIKNGQKVVVAVIDSGVDFMHEDLQGKIWTNSDEIPGNGIDDDANGYIDDIYGWNFVTNKDGSTLSRTTLEVTRELSRIETKEAREGLSQKEKAYKLELETNYNSQVASRKSAMQKYTEEKAYFVSILAEIGLDAKSADAQTISEIADSTTKDELLSYLAKYSRARAKTIADVFKYADKRVSTYQEDLVTYFRKHWDQRAESYDDFSHFSLKNPAYGNNDVMDLNGHGTHVAGIIAANRSNDLGIKGVSDAVEIMILRAVPNGDEADTDVYHAIRYAVDNGARVINMSFGKDFSRHPEKVKEAFEYAHDKGVLLVHSAGNSSNDNNIIKSFPMRSTQELSRSLGSWIEVAASSHDKGEKLPASFTNYGSKSVDLFAPGVAIKSSYPKQEYASLSGTSMAAPVVAGVAALMLNYDADLTSTEIKALMMDNLRKHDDLEVRRPGTTDDLLNFKDMTVGGGIIDAKKIFEAMR